MTSSTVDRAKLQSLISGYTQTTILFTAVELGLFDELARSGRASAIAAAEALQLSPAATEHLLDALAAFGVVDKVDGMYGLSAATAATLTRDGQSSETSTLLHYARHLAPLFARLGDAVRTGTPQVASGWPFSRGHVSAAAALAGAPAELEIFVAAEEQAAVGEGSAIAELISLGDIETLVDYGGCAGQVSIELARANPKLRVLLVEQAEVVTIAERRIAAAGLADQIFCVAGDVRTGMVLPDSVECVLLSSVLSRHGHADQRRILAAVRELTEAGARLLISERLLDDDRTGPEEAARASLERFVMTGSCGLTREAVDDLLRATGFGIEAVYAHAGRRGRRDLVVARAIARR
jgi:hypothetical protein